MLEVNPRQWLDDDSAVSRLATRLSSAGYAFTALDVGCRREVCPELHSIRAAVDAVGFDADVAAAAELEGRAAGWHGLRVLPLAVGRDGETVTLHLTRARGCSSLMPPNEPLARAFSRQDRHVIEDRVPLHTRSLDRLADEAAFDPPRHLKIDVQGWEMIAFEGSERLLRETLASVRVEVSFRPTYEGQPLFADIDAHLQARGFVPAVFPELHAWRRSSQTRPDHLARGARPFSQGELMHADVLYLRDPNAFPPCAADARIAAGLVALLYGLVDYAAAVWGEAAVRERLAALLGGGESPERVLDAVSADFARRFRNRALHDAWTALRRGWRGR